MSEQVNERHDMRNDQIIRVLDTIPQEQNVDGYVDTKGKAGFRNPVRPVVGNGLTELVRRLQPGQGVELGTALGRSGLHMALGGLRNLDTVEFDPGAASEAQTNFDLAGVNVAGQFQVFNSDSGDFTRSYNKPIDLVFIDHAKERYLEDFQALEPHLTDNAVVLMDNTFNRASECKEAVDYVAANYYSAIFTEPPTGQDETTTGLLVAAKNREVFNAALGALLDVRGAV